MSRPAGRPAFDQQERERIQRALRRYMEEHRIGTPTLQLRIMEADEHRRELPLSTLQRFITGSHRTSDAYVDMCRRFLEVTGAQPEAIDFAEALAGNFGEEDLKQAHQLLAGFAGEYVIHADSGDEGRSANSAHARARFDPVPGKPYLKVAEAQHDVTGEPASRRRHRYEGALIVNGRSVHCFLRSCLTRQPKSYALRYPGRTSMLEGAALYADLENEIRQLTVRLVDSRTGAPVIAREARN